MPIKRILVLQSVEDEITDKRKNKILNNPELNEFTFAFCYAVELTVEQKALPTQEMVNAVAAQSLAADDLAARLITAINAFNPDLIIVHPGFVFRSFQPAFLAALKSIRAQFPALKLGTFNSHQLPHLRATFDEGAVLEIVERVFWFERNRWRIITVGSPFSQN